MVQALSHCAGMCFCLSMCSICIAQARLRVQQTDRVCAAECFSPCLLCEVNTIHGPREGMRTVHVSSSAQVASRLFQVVAGLALRGAQRGRKQVRAERALAFAGRVALGLVAQRQRGLRRVVHNLHRGTSVPALGAAYTRSDLQACASADDLPYTKTQHSNPTNKQDTRGMLQPCCSCQRRTGRTRCIAPTLCSRKCLPCSCSNLATGTKTLSYADTARSDNRLFSIRRSNSLQPSCSAMACSVSPRLTGHGRTKSCRRSVAICSMLGAGRADASPQWRMKGSRNSCIMHLLSGGATP
jgi:hypothetical protein